MVAGWWRGSVAPVLEALAARMAGAARECAFRLALAFRVLAGRVPVVRPRRWWNRATEPPVLIDAFDWTDERLLFSVLVWPPLQGPAHASHRDHRERARMVLDVLHKGAADMNWSTLYEVGEGARWDPTREVWTGSDGFAHDGQRLRRYARAGS